MTDKKLKTEPYKGVRDFYPRDMAIQSYIFKNWAKTAESFGFERYDASILEPADLYKAKGVENEELVNEQTYTFIDRGDREVTLRPEMTPTVARMVAGKSRELKFPLRWYSIPNLFRYERPQRGRLREHWQLNCDIFGSDDYTADVEIIALAYQTLIDFGATPDMFTIHINNREDMKMSYNKLGITDEGTINKITSLNDRKNKISTEDYRQTLLDILKSEELAEKVINLIEGQTGENQVISALKSLGISNIKLDRTIARGFNYYTSTVFEIFDTSLANNRSLLGGGRYNNLTSMFSSELISGVGFGFGDVTMRDFLETHNLLPNTITNTGPDLVIIPTDETLNLEAQKIAQQFRKRDINTSTNIGTKKLAKKITDAVDLGTKYAIIVGNDEITTGKFVLKNLLLTTEKSGTLEELLTEIITKTK